MKRIKNEYSLTWIVFWIRWFFWESRRCKHLKSHWEMRDLGMGKVRWCKRCDKCLELI